MKILVVDDDRAVSDMIKLGLSSDTHTVEVAKDGADGSFLGRSYEYDAIILDYSMPGKDGLAVCREIRNAGRSTPILFLSVADELPVKISAFEAGADDYMTKPFSVEELRARVKAITRRSDKIRKPIITVADLRLDSEKMLLWRGEKLVRLTRKEFCLIEYLMRNAGIIVSRAMIMEHVWTADSDPLSNTVEVHIRNLRKKLNGRGRPNLILNFQGRGYVVDTPENLKTFKEGAC